MVVVGPPPFALDHGRDRRRPWDKPFPACQGNEPFVLRATHMATWRMHIRSQSSNVEWLTRWMYWMCPLSFTEFSSKADIKNHS